MGERTKESGATIYRDRKAAGPAEGRSDRDAQDHDRDRKSAESKEESDHKPAKTEDKERIDRDRKSAETGDRAVWIAIIRVPR